MLGSLMLVVATICIAAGSWQIERLIDKHDANDRLRANAHLATSSVAEVLGDTTSDAALADGDQAQFRHVTATGTYRPGGELLVRERTENGVVGYLVLTPLVTDTPDRAVLLVVRGFLPANGDQTPTATAPPAGRVTVTGRVQPTEDRDDRYGQPAGQVRTINIASAADRLGSPVFGGYIELLAGQPGTSQLTAIPDPDLSNPAGGAIEPQHLAYVVQWYLFAALALAAPLVMARADSRRDDPDSSAPPAGLARLAGLSDDIGPPDPSPEELARTARLTDRYGSARRY